MPFANCEEKKRDLNQLSDQKKILSDSEIDWSIYGRQAYVANLSANLSLLSVNSIAHYEGNNIWFIINLKRVTEIVLRYVIKWATDQYRHTKKGEKNKKKKKAQLL